MYKEFGISEEIEILANECEKEIEEELKKVDEVQTANSIRVLNAFHNNNLSSINRSSIALFLYFSVSSRFPGHSPASPAVFTT